MVGVMVVATAGCGSSIGVLGTGAGAEKVAQSRAVEVAGPPLEVVDVELFGLNGRENADREPIVTVLLKPPSTRGRSSPVEGALAALRAQGWRLKPAEAGEWWSWEGERGNSYGALGAADTFITDGKAAEGYAPIAFKDAVAAQRGQLVVFSVEVLP